MERDEIIKKASIKNVKDHLSNWGEAGFGLGECVDSCKGMLTFEEVCAYNKIEDDIWTETERLLKELKDSI